MFDKDIKNLEILSILDIARQGENGDAKERPIHALSLRTEGSACFSYKAQQWHVHANDIILIPKGIDYHIKSTPEKLFCIHFLADNMPDEIVAFTPSNPGIFRELFSSAYRKWSQKKAGYTMAVISDMFKIISLIQSQQSALKISANTMNYVIEYIHDNFNRNNMSIKQLSEIINTSESYFYKQFKDTFNISPMQYINNLRFNRALELIKSGYYKISEIAEMTGFNDSKYFSAFIKQRTGYSPAELKKCFPDF